MKILALIAVLALSVPAQELITADGAEWRYIATGRDRDGAKFNVFARQVKGGTYPALEVKFGKAEPLRAEHDCKRKLYRLDGGKWAKPAGTVGQRLIKYACGR